jgi:hypothetical protein
MKMFSNGEETLLRSPRIPGLALSIALALTPSSATCPGPEIS